MANRAILFVDGNNWYHSLRDTGVEDLGRLDYARISQKLVGPRQWTGTRYYIGRVRQKGDPQLYAGQRRFLSQLGSTDGRITCHLGRLETRTVKNDAASELKRYLSGLRTRIDRTVFHSLMDIARRHQSTEVLVEKAVDVMLAVEMVVMAERDQFDAAYLLSADGDFTPAVEAVRSHDKKVYVASPARGAQLARKATAFITLTTDWFVDCYRV